MKRAVLSLLLATSAIAADLPSTRSLYAALASAELQWGEHADVRSVQFADLGSCVFPGVVAWSDLVTRDIRLNSECRHWDRESVRVAMLHEYGHMLAGSSVHSIDRHSVMYRIAIRGQKIRKADREWVLAHEDRPTILIGSKEGGGGSIYF